MSHALMYFKVVFLKNSGYQLRLTAEIAHHD